MSGELLETKMVEKVWGRDILPAPFDAPDGKTIGEIWFHSPPALEALLAKYLFTSEKLSVQVHPDDARAPAGARGKDECWLVLDAEPGAKLAIGFDEEQSPETVREAAKDGSIEELLTWHDVEPGDFFYLPAGTVHAIGGGLSICELQRNSEITYRLYDYGRPRELHLDEAMAVASLEPYPDHLRQRVNSGESCNLVDGPYFRVDLVTGSSLDADLAAISGATMVLPLEGCAAIGDMEVPGGAAGWTDTISDLRLDSSDARVLLFSKLKSSTR